jgi:hypothetical protein
MFQLSIAYHEWVTKEGSQLLEMDIDDCESSVGRPQHRRTTSSSSSVSSAITFNSLGPMKRNISEPYVMSKSLTDFKKMIGDSSTSLGGFPRIGEEEYLVEDSFSDESEECQPDIIYAVS